MSGTETALSPHDSLELLSAIARADTVKPSAARTIDDAARDIVAALRDRALLVACAGEDVAIRAAGPDGGAVLPVFTDSEAADAWIAAQHPDAASVSVQLRGETSEDEEGWLEICTRHRVSALAINAAGPAGCMVYTAELARLRPRQLHRRPTPDPGRAWLDLDERCAERERGGERLARLARAVHNSDAPAADAIAAEPGPINRLRSLLWGAELHRLGGRLRLDNGQPKLGLEELAFAGARFRLAGEPHHATDALLEAAQRLTERRSDDGDWAATRLAMVRESLRQLAVTGYRVADISRLDGSSRALCALG
jgi:hypothetical protein